MIGKYLSSIQKREPLLLFFVSSFCSKCRVNRRNLQEFIPEDLIVELNIASPNAIIDEVQPRMVPTLVLVDADHRILYVKEGILSSQEAEILQKSLEKLI